MAAANRLLGSAVGVRRGWRTKALSPSEVLARLGEFEWLRIAARGDLLAHRAWAQRGFLRRIDAAFSDGSRVSFLQSKSGWRVRVSRDDGFAEAQYV